jgi:large subunit ribosomal protein L13
MKTIFYSKKNVADRKWLLVNAENVILGKLSSKISLILQGKNKIWFTPHSDLGDFVVLINSSKVVLSGKKKYKKIYWHHTGYPGGIKKTTFLDLQNRHPNRVIQHAVKGMLPKSKLGHSMIKKLKIYSDNHHPHAAQKPTPINI